MRSRHLELLKSLSDKNREREEQQKREERRISERESIIRDHVLHRSRSSETRSCNGASNVAAAAGRVISNLAPSGVPSTLRAQKSVLGSCNNAGLQEYLANKGKPRALPKLPVNSLSVNGDAQPHAGSTQSLLIGGLSVEDAMEAEEEGIENAFGDIDDGPAAVTGLIGDAVLAQTSCSSPARSSAPSAAPQKTRTSINRFIERTKLSRTAAHCYDILEWKRHGGCGSSQQVFICNGGYPDFRDALLKRGWFQNPNKKSSHFDLKWGMANDIDHERLRPDQIVNHFDRCRDLTTKVGLSLNLRNSAWFSGVDLEEFYPRAFDLYDPLERADFVVNFKLTKAESILRQFLQHLSEEADMTFSQDVVRTAFKICLRLLTDVDEVIDCPEMAETLTNVSACEWAVLKRVCLDDVTRKLELATKDGELEEMIARTDGSEMRKRVQHAREKDKESESRRGSKSSKEKKKKKECEEAEAEEVPLCAPTASFNNARGQYLVRQAESVVKELEQKSVQHSIHGTRNAWIVKPAGKSRGRGIQVMRELDEIFKATENDGYQWVCQKYIEQPQLIHGYKFDIRQWVLVADWNPLTFYIWQQPYLRFAGQKYDSSLSSLSEYMHLVNNSIIKHMDGFEEKNVDLNASGYMWFRQQYEEYLHDTLCKCERHNTPWKQPPPYTCASFGVRWEDVKFIAKEEDEEDDDDDSPGIANMNPPSSDTSTCLPAVDAEDVVDLEETRASSPCDSEDFLQQNLRRSDSVIFQKDFAEWVSLGSRDCKCGRHFEPSTDICSGCGRDREPDKELADDAGKKVEKEQDQQHVEATSKDAVRWEEREEQRQVESVQGNPDRRHEGQVEQQAADATEVPDHVCENLWDTCIKPQIGNIVTWSLLSVVDNVGQRKNSYEVFGYDFMLSPGVDGRPKVWLIEVNSSPACDYSTPVTTPLVKKMMEDTAKVMVDRQTEPDCDTGEWELWKHPYAKHVSCRTNATYLEKLEVCGTQIKPPKDVVKKKKKTIKGSKINVGGAHAVDDECADGKTLDADGGGGEEDA